MPPYGLSDQLAAAVVKNGFIDYVKLTGIAKGNGQLAEEAGKLLQEALRGGRRTETFWGDAYVKVTQEGADGQRVEALFSVGDDNIPARITQTEFDARDNEIRVQQDRNADGNPEEIHENEYYYLGDYSKIKKTVNIFDDDSDGKPDNGFSQEMNQQGMIIKSEPLKFD